MIPRRKPRKPSHTAWAVVGKRSGAVLRAWNGQCFIYVKCLMAKYDCPSYGEVRRVSIRVMPREKP